MTTEFARWLAEVSRARDWRQKDLASAVGVSQQTASRWLLGQSVPTVRSARAIAAALDVPTDEVVSRLGPDAMADEAAAGDELAALRRRVADLEAQLRRRGRG